MADDIKNIQLKFSCKVNWETLTPDGNGRFCSLCQKKVYDFTDSRAAEFAQIMAANNYNICGRFTQQQLLPQPTQIPAWKRWISAAILLLGINLFGHKAEAQQTSEATTTSTKNSQDFILGEVIDIPPQFAGGGPEKFEKFIYQHLDKANTSFKGRLTVTFVVESDGSLTNIQAVNYISDKTAVDEAIRVVKLSPKWTPGKRNGKSIRMQYSIRVNF